MFVVSLSHVIPSLLITLEYIKFHIIFNKWKIFAWLRKFNATQKQKSIKYVSFRNWVDNSNFEKIKIFEEIFHRRSLIKKSQDSTCNSIRYIFFFNCQRKICKSEWKHFPPIWRNSQSEKSRIQDWPYLPLGFLPLCEESELRKCKSRLLVNANCSMKGRFDHR